MVRKVKNLNNIVKHDHQASKDYQVNAQLQVIPGRWNDLAGIWLMHMICKCRVALQGGIKLTLQIHPV